MKIVKITFEGKNIECHCKPEGDLIKVELFSDSFKRFEGEIPLKGIIEQIPLLEEYSLEEVYEVINEQDSENFVLKKDNDKFKLEISLVILKKKKAFYIELEENFPSEDEDSEDLQKKNDNEALISSLLAENERLQKENRELKIRNGIISVEMEELKKANEKLKTQLKELNLKYGILSVQYNDLKKEKNESKREMDEPKKSGNSSEKENNKENINEIDDDSDEEEDNEYFKNFIMDKNTRPKRTICDYVPKIERLLSFPDGKILLLTEAKIHIFSSDKCKLLTVMNDKFIKKLRNIIILKDGKFALYEEQKFKLKIYKITNNESSLFQEIKFDKDFMPTALSELKNGQLWVSEDKIYVFQTDSSGKYYECDEIDKLENAETYFGIIDAGDNEVLISARRYSSYFLIFYDLKNKEVVGKITDVTDRYFRFYRVNKKIIIANDDSRNAIIINYKKRQYIDTIQITSDSDCLITSICVLKPNLVVFGDQKGSIIQYKSHGENLEFVSEKKYAHADSDVLLANLPNGHFVSACPKDKKVLIW